MKYKISKSIAVLITLATLISTVITPSFSAVSSIPLDQTNSVTVVNVSNSVIPKVKIHGDTYTNLFVAELFEPWTHNSSTDGINVTTSFSDDHYCESKALPLSDFGIVGGDTISIHYEDNNTIQTSGTILYQNSNGNYIGEHTILSGEKANLYIPPAASSVYFRGLRSGSKHTVENKTFRFSFAKGHLANQDMPFVLGTQDMSDLLIERRGGNLFPGKESFSKDRYVVYKTGELGTSLGWYASNYIMVDSGQNYTFNALVPSANAGFAFYDSNKEFLSGSFVVANVQTIQMPDNACYMRYTVRQDDITFDKMMIISGKTLPSKYIEPELEQLFVEGNFGKGCTVTIGGSEVKVEREWSKVSVLHGEYIWEFADDQVGFKRVKFDLTGLEANNSSTIITSKFNSKNLSIGDTINDYDYAGWSGTEFWVSIADSDSGWGEDYTQPTDSEIKAYFNGWVAYDIASASYITKYTLNANKRWAKRWQGIGTKGTLAHGIDIENATARSVCPSDKAYGDITETYTLRYKLATPQIETINLDGVLSLKAGVNQISIRTGIRKELVYPSYEDGRTRINDSWDNNKNQNFSTYFDKKSSSILNIMTDDSRGEIKSAIGKFTFDDSGYVYTFGRSRAYTDSGVDLTNDSKKYYVVYETLDEVNNSKSFIASISYDDSAGSSVGSLYDEVSNLNNRISSLEKLINEMINPSKEGTISFEYDDNGNLKNVNVK